MIIKLEVGQIWCNNYPASGWQGTQHHIISVANGLARADIHYDDGHITRGTSFAHTDSDGHVDLGIDWYQYNMSPEEKAKQEERKRRETHAEKYL